MTGLTVALLSWQRVGQTTELVAHYSAMQEVSQIMVFDNNWESNLDKLLLRYPKMVYVRSARNLGVIPRFAMASLAQTEAVFMTDDDIVVPNETLAELWSEQRAMPHQVHGLFGRRFMPDESYHTRNQFGPVDVVLTRAALTSVQTIAAAHTQLVRMDALVNPTPRGNGEDIVLSFVAMRKTGYYNWTYKLPYRNLVHADEHAISTMSSHMDTRNQVLGWCRQYIV